MKVAGPCDKVQIAIYSRAMVCLAKLDGPGSAQAGWVQVRLPAGALASQRGLSLFRCRALGVAEGSGTKIGTLMVFALTSLAAFESLPVKW